MKENYFTIGEIFRGGMLFTNDGEYYKSKASVSQRLSRVGATYVEKKSPFGMAKMYSDKEISRVNNLWK